MSDLAPVLEFLPCRTPDAWIARAVSDIPTLLLDHAALELKAAQQAQRMIWRYGVASQPESGAFEFELLNKMSRLAREELRHFEQVAAILEARGIEFRPVSASRYAGALHEPIRDEEPERLIDTLIVGAIIEARSCERFHSLVPSLESTDPELAEFYESLLKAEARHFSDYLELAEKRAGASITDRIEFLLEREAELILSPDRELRFHSGTPQ